MFLFDRETILYIFDFLFTFMIVIDYFKKINLILFRQSKLSCTIFLDSFDRDFYNFFSKDIHARKESLPHT